MGTFDTLRFHGEISPRCAAGHRIESLQTKDLDCSMSIYAVYEGRLYRPGKDRGETVRLDECGQLVLTSTRIAESAAMNAELRAYGSCRECRPVLFLGERALFGDYVQERRPWCEWRFVFRNGRLEGYEPVRVESRETVAQVLRREGLEVLADDERLARLHFERTAKDDWSDW